MHAHRVVTMLGLSVVAFTPLMAFPQPAPEGSGTSGRTVDFTILLDASTSMEPAWDQCRTHLPVLLEGLRVGDSLRLIVFGRAEDMRTVVDQKVSSEADIASVEERLAGIECDLRGSIMSVGFEETIALWSDSVAPKVFIVVTDAIVWPATGPAHEAEWTARWESARPLRQDSSVHRVVFGVRTKEPGADSIERLEQVLLPHQVLMLGEDDPAAFRAGLEDLRAVVARARVPSATQVASVADASDPLGVEGSHWVFWAGLGLVVVFAAGALRAAKRRHATAGSDADEPVAGTLLVEAWGLDGDHRRTGDPETWHFDVPVRGMLEVLVGGPDHAQARCRVPGLELLSPDPLVLKAERGGLRSVLIPSFETVLVKDAVPGFNSSARCLEEELYRRLDAGGEPRLCPVQGSVVLIRVLPGRNELKLSFDAAEFAGERNKPCAGGLLGPEEGHHDWSD